MSEQRKRQTLYEGATVLLFSTALAKIISALFKIPLSSDYCLGDLGFGYFSAAHDFFTPFHMIAISGFSVAVSKIIADFTADNRFKDAKETFKISRKLLFWLGVLTFIIIGFLIIPFVNATDKTGLGVYSYFAMLPCVIFCFWASAYRGYYEGLGNMNPAAVSNIIEAFGKLILGFGLAFIVVKLTGNAAFAAAAAMVGITIGAFLSAFYLHIKYKASGGITKSELQHSAAPLEKKEILKTVIMVSVPIVLSSLSSSVVTLVDAITVRWQLSGSIIALGEYYPEFTDYVEGLPTVLYGIRSKAFTLYNLVPTLTMVIGVSSIPVLAEAYSKGKKEKVSEGVSSVFKLSALITLPAAAGFISLGGRIMALLYGADISSVIGGKMLSLFGIALVFSGLAIPLGSALQALSLQRKALINVAVGILVKITANLILCSNIKLNIYGSVYATLLCYIVIFILHLITLLKETGRLTDIKNACFKPSLAAVLCGLIAYLISLIGEGSIITVLSIFVGALVYFAVLSLTKAFTEADILSLPMGEKILKILKKVNFIKK